MRIYGRANAWNVRKVLFLAEELGLKYERLDYGRGFKPADSPELLALNPNAMVPVLSDGDVTLWESHTILRYLGAKYGQGAVYPADLVAKSAVDRWLDWKLGHVSPAMRPLFFRYFLKTGDFSDREVAEGETESAKLFTILDAQLKKTGGFAASKDFTVADCAIGIAVHRWLSLPLKRPELANVADYYRRLSERPAYRKTILIGMP